MTERGITRAGAEERAQHPRGKEFEDAFTEILLFATGSCFERTVLIDCKEHLWSEVVAPSATPETLSSVERQAVNLYEGKYFERFFAVLLKTWPLTSAALYACKERLWRAWVVRVGEIENGGLKYP